VAAFARSAQGQTLLIAAPIQIASLTRGALTLPIGHEVWRDFSLTIPGDQSRVYRDVFTGRALEPVAQNGKAALKLAEVFGQFPVAALLGD
jgi:maltooligosyltrehalose synthase